MLSYPVPTRQKHHVWVLVADGKQARIFACRSAIHNISPHHFSSHKEQTAYDLVPVQNGILMAESISDFQDEYQRYGLASNSTSPDRPVHEPHGDLKKAVRRRYIKAIIDRLQQAHTHKLFDRLVLAAPAKMIGELREQLSPGLQRCLIAVLSKDLAHFHGNELLYHLEDTLAEAHVRKSLAQPIG